LLKRALAFTVPVVVSIWLSKVEKVPWPSGVMPSWSSAVTGRPAPLPAALLMSASWAWGTVNWMSMGSVRVMVAMPLVSDGVA
jgi:hypothetical protein